MQLRGVYNLGESCQAGHQSWRRISGSVYGVQHENETEATRAIGVFEHSTQLDIQLSQGLAAFCHVFLGPLEGLGDGGDYGLEQVTSRDALRSVDDGIADIRDIDGEMVEEGAGDGGLPRSFDAVEGEVTAGRCVGL